MADALVVLTLMLVQAAGSCHAGQQRECRQTVPPAMLTIHSRWIAEPTGHSRVVFYHDGRFITLGEVVQHYDRHFGLGLTHQEMVDLIEYLKSI